ncbi:MAG: cytochrome c oxidase subunit 3 [Candidatus Promineifilaceae bacterium]|nr:cytochrome c oxidase subunit 3 [Candidatus Promineifilaceae bacterium]
MSAAITDTVTRTPETHEEEPFSVRLERNRLALWLFIFSELFLFGGLLAARFYLWGGERPELNQVLGLIATSILLVSSFFMARSETAIAHGDRKAFLRNLLITAALGTLFLVGVVGVEWQGEVAPSDGKWGAIFFGMTGIHALHVLSGVIFLLIVWNNGRKGHYSAERHWGVEACAIYWHFVDVAWVFFYPALYLIGSPVHIG